MLTDVKLARTIRVVNEQQHVSNAMSEVSVAAVQPTASRCIRLYASFVVTLLSITSECLALIICDELKPKFLSFSLVVCYECDVESTF